MDEYDLEEGMDEHDLEEGMDEYDLEEGMNVLESGLSTVWQKKGWIWFRGRDGCVRVRSLNCMRTEGVNMI